MFLEKIKSLLEKEYPFHFEEEEEWIDFTFHSFLPLALFFMKLSSLKILQFFPISKHDILVMYLIDSLLILSNHIS